MEIKADGLGLIAAERTRQIEVKGYTAEEDDDYRSGEILQAATELLLKVDYSEPMADIWGIIQRTKYKFPDPVQADFRLLVIAGALVAAELDRRLRVNAEPLASSL